LKKSLVFLLEEPSAKDALEGFLPTIVPKDLGITYLVFEGKQDLEKRMARTLRAWQDEHARFIVLRDQDCGDCVAIKQGLTARCHESGRGEKSMVRIACRELEAWFIGDWSAVAQAFNNTKLSKLQKKALYRDPDGLPNPVAEIKKYIPDYQKRDGARRIGPFLALENNVSRSLQVFVQAIQSWAIAGHEDGA
jgi:hypothetical protein